MDKSNAVSLGLSLEEKIRGLKGPIFVFGASGFIGANLIESILKYRTDCYAISHNIRYAWRLKLLNLEPENILYCNILLKGSLEKIFQEYNPQTVFNLSAYGAYSKQNKNNLIYETNIIGTFNILEHCKNISAYVHAGSSSEYGYNCEGPDESDEMIPNSHYAVSKASSGYLLKYYARAFQLPCVNLRLYSIYGPWEEPDRLIPRLLEKAKQKDLPPLVSPAISRDFVYVTDCVEAFINSAVYLAPDAYGESINIGTGVKTTLGGLVEKTIDLFGLKIRPEWGSMDDRKWDMQNWFGNYGKAQKLINWEPKTSLEAGLAFTSKWQDEQNYTTRILPIFEKPERLTKISCIIACYKDAQAIPIMYKRLVEMFSKIQVNYEIIFVNDSSPDNSQEVLEEICTADPDVIAITHSRNFGSQSAFVSGMEISTGDGIVLMDGDLQDPPEIIPSFFEKWLEGYEVVYGKRVRREASFIMNFFYKLFYRVFSRLSYIPIPLDAGDFSLIDRKAVDQLLLLPEKEIFLRGLRAWIGFRQTGVDYVRPERMFGTSTNNWRRNFGWARKAIFSFSFVPLEMMSYAGFVLTGFSFLAIIVQIIGRLVYPDIPHGVTTIIVLILFFGGIQLLAASFLGEYLSKVFEETKGRPKYIRKSVIRKGKKLESITEIDSLIKRTK